MIFTKAKVVKSFLVSREYSKQTKATGDNEHLGLFKNVQMQVAQKAEQRGVYEYTLRCAVCSATQQTMVPFRV
jgi:hypothetical protein